MTTELAKLIEQEESAMKELDDAKMKADGIVRDAEKRAKAIVESAGDESAFQAFVEERLKEIEQNRRNTISQAEEECGRLAAKAESNLKKAVDLAVQRIL